MIIGHARIDIARVAATALARLDLRWRTRAGHGELARAGRVLAAAGPPLHRPTSGPVLWVMAGGPAGWAQMVCQLLWPTDWTPADTIVFTSLTDHATIDLRLPDCGW